MTRLQFSQNITLLLSLGFFSLKFHTFFFSKDVLNGTGAFYGFSVYVSNTINRHDGSLCLAYTTVIGTQNLPFLVPFTCLFTVRTMDNTSYSTMSDFPELHTLPVILRWFMPPSVKWRFTVFVLNEYFVVYVILMYAFFLMILAMI